MSNRDANKTLGQAIRKQRKALDLSQEEVARLANCGPLFVIELERGKPTVRLDKLLDVLRVLGLQLTLEQGRNGLEVR